VTRARDHEDSPPPGTLEVHPATPDRWNDLERLFGPRGACGGCWCMWWRLTAKQFEQQKGEKNHRAMKRIVQSGEIPGLLAYADGKPVGWCSVAPRGAYPRLDRSRVLKRVDDAPVWSIVCFFVTNAYRRRGVMRRLIAAAIDYARSRGGTILEGYPTEPKGGRSPDLFLFHGVPSAFLEAGFVEVARRSQRRPIMRYVIDQAWAEEVPTLNG